jgi:DNA-binding CsgD family transcriptional regulator
MLPVNLAILDRAGTIVSVNATWKSFGRSNGLKTPRSGLGQNYLSFCKTGPKEVRQFARRLESVLSRAIDLTTFVYECDSASKKRLFVGLAVQLAPDPDAGVALLHVSISPLLETLRAGVEQLGPATRLVERTAIQALSDNLTTLLQPDARTRNRQRPAPDFGLTPRQLDVLRLLGEGRNNKEIASALVRSPNTIKIHVAEIMKRLNVRSRTEAALIYSRSLRDTGR